MSENKVVAGFIGAGGIARSHAYSLNSLRYFYNDLPEIILESVCSFREESRKSFAGRYGFKSAVNLKDFVANNEINTVYILGPNNVHYQHLASVIEMPSVDRIYLEKPVCSNKSEEKAISELSEKHPDIKIQVGFQYLLTASVREALALWKSGELGKPLHFDLKYYHGDYLRKGYRDKRATRLVPAPDGGAMADLGSHALSMLVSFLGDRIKITGALQGGHFEDVNVGSDLFSSVSLIEESTKAVGTLSASRISAGTGDQLSIEIFAEKGALRYSSVSADYFEYFLEETGVWSRIMVGSSYKPVTSFPSEHVPPGWLRSMIHAHYVFITGNDSKAFIPDIKHGLSVQRLVTETADHLHNFRELRDKL